MRRSNAISLLILFLSSMMSAQVVSPSEIKDAGLRSLQVQYMDDLTKAGRDVLALKFDYPFYLSRKLDLDLAVQQKSEQSGLQFNTFNGKTVLGISGNYYVAYSGEQVGRDQRAQKTFVQLALPILKVVVPRFQTNKDIQGYAVEVSHHVLTKVMGVSMQSPENFVVYLPQQAAIRLVAAKDETAQQSALLQAQSFVNAEPVTLWISGEGPQLPPQTEDAQKHEDAGKASADSPEKAKAESKPAAPAPPPRDLSPAALSTLQTEKQAQIAELVKGLNEQAHFVSYTNPAFVAFREGIYLDLSITTNLPESAAGSRYKVAASAFDEHVSHLIRPALTYFKDEQAFDGIGFSTSVHISGKCCTNFSEAVEYYFPFSALQCYAKYDCTGQQLIDAGTVLVNGERIGLELQSAESK
jgi:hypothetical protein